jgi:hypothetical protein
VIHILFWGNPPGKVESFIVGINPCCNQKDIIVYDLCPSSINCNEGPEVRPSLGGSRGGDE